MHYLETVHVTAIKWQWSKHTRVDL